ncbi:PREDICTED: lymphocyte antigen 96 [Gavialis gangeticus]|uniref:lymphocyte antigen 96 n=1 Tax=Gavialis gangeticus TaxID=94835 RepID=UPI00092FC2B3|nr:PREDICTED: lymphocyte antigen 96 [Gavialis gangeticus]
MTKPNFVPLSENKHSNRVFTHITQILSPLFLGRYITMFKLVLFILFIPGFSSSQRRELICRSSDIELSYSFCDSMKHNFFFNITPCSLIGKPQWEGSVFWIPRSDIIFLKINLSLWYHDAKALDWKQIICTGIDDDYSFCGTLKGETINTTINIRGLTMELEKGEYTVLLRGFPNYFEENLLICLNLTMLYK